MEAKAILRTVRISPQKARLVADQVRGLPVARALNLLTFSDKKAAEIIYKVVYSATSNAENNNGADVDELKVSSIMVDSFPEGLCGRLSYTARCGDVGCYATRAMPQDPVLRHVQLLL